MCLVVNVTEWIYEALDRLSLDIHDVQLGFRIRTIESSNQGTVVGFRVGILRRRKRCLDPEMKAEEISRSLYLVSVSHFSYMHRRDDNAGIGTAFAIQRHQQAVIRLYPASSVSVLPSYR